MKTCRICGFINKPEAEKCAVCQSEFNPSTIKISNKATKGRKKRPISLVAELVIIFIMTCALVIPALFLIDSYGWVFENPTLVIIGSFAVVFTVLFASYTFIRESYEKRHGQNHVEEEEDEQDAYYVSNDVSSETEDFIKSKTEKEQDISKLAFCEQVAAISKQTPYAALNFDTQMTVSEAADRMAQSSDLSSAQLRMMLAAMASRRLIVICGDSQNNSAAVLQSVSALTGTEAIDVTLEEACADPTTLLVAENPQRGPLPSQFLSALCVGADEPALCLVDLKATATNKLTSAFSDLIPYLNNASVESNVKARGVNRRYANITGDATIVLPANRRIFLRISSDRQIPLDAELLRSTAWIEAKAVTSKEAVADKSDVSEAVSVLSFNRLLQLTEESEKVYYLSEATWKRIDELCDYLKQLVEFRMDNKLAVAMEQFVGIYMASGGSEQEATDAVIASLILPQTLALLSRKQDRDHGPLLQFIDGHFGMENLPICADFLKKYGTI